MNITIKYHVAKKIKSTLAEAEAVFGDFDEDSHRHSDCEVDLAKLTRDEVVKLRDTLKTSGVTGTKVVAADIEKYLRAADTGDVATMTARNVRQAAWIMEHVVAGLPHHMVFSEDEYEGGSHVAYFVGDVDYIPARDGGRYEGRTPEMVKVKLYWIESERRQAMAMTMDPSDVIGKTAQQMLREQGYLVETPALVEKLARETEEYYRVRKLVGTKYTGRGYADGGLDDATERERFSFGRGRGGKIRLDNFGIRSPIVIDVLSEKDSSKDEDGGSDASLNLYRWHKWNLRFFSPGEDEVARHLEADEDSDFAPTIQVPVHPLIPVFDLKRHERVLAHVNNMTAYEYRPQVAANLIIPKRDRDLIEMLVDHSSNTFRDVVEGKGASMNILSAGPPGTGKTLTAEIFAEYKGRPLYTVQCSQLGVEPSDIEKNLGVILQRANRWNAILLLDEADVYIRARGEDLHHNAIVGVFLRVLEYAECVLFMTTNRADIVDDAIASRCIVKINYEVPEVTAQAKIWRALADVNEFELSDDTIAEFASRHAHVSGRDVKNLIKLASFVATKRSAPIEIADLEYALQYKPTASAPLGDHRHPVKTKAAVLAALREGK